MSQLDILLIVLRVAFGALVPLCFIAVLVWMERRGCAFIQDRSGPNRCNIFGFRAAGLVQNLADAVKLLTKEDVIPAHIRHKFYFVLAPVIVFAVGLISYVLIRIFTGKIREVKVGTWVITILFLLMLFLTH